jgi:hypothetical protein
VTKEEMFGESLVLREESCLIRYLESGHERLPVRLLSSEIELLIQKAVN